MKSLFNIALAGVSLAALATPVYAQTAKPDAKKASTEEKDIVVTGTLIRGTVATGSQTLTVDAKAIADVASSSTNELLAAIPQIGSFNSRPEGDPRGLTAVSSIVRPNIRNFPSTNSTSGALTLMLLDGSRVTPLGTNASSPDADIFPTAVLAGVDIVTDGGSSLYGADAVAGVMNFRTMKKFDGIKVDGNYGFGDRIKGYHEWDGAVTAGKSWSTGNAYVSVGHTERDAVLNSQTPWANGTIYTAAGVPKFQSTTCNTPQATEARWFRYGPGATQFTNNPLAPGAGTFALGTGCDQVLASTYLPSLKRTNVFASITNSFSDTVDFRMTGYWMKRDLGLPGYPLGFASQGSGITSAAQLTAAYPAALAISQGALFAVPEGTGFALGPNASYVNKPQKISDETWGVTPELTVKLGGNWALRSSLHYGYSHDATHYAGLNQVQAQCYITGCTAAQSTSGTAIAAGQLDPLNVAAASSSVIGDITNWETAQQSTHSMFDFKSVADGRIFAAPGGDAKLAVGIEYQGNTAQTRLYTGQNGIIGTLPYKSASQNVKSLFAELHLPLTKFLDLAGSVRYDSYSDFGTTANPTAGFTVKPTSWLKFYGHWGTSFNAPTAYDDIGVGLGRAGVNYTAAIRPTVAVGKTDNGAGTYFIVLTGNSPQPPLQPQTSEDWALGFDAKPTHGLSVGAEYYNISIKNSLGSVNPANGATYTTNPSAYIYNNELTANGNALFTTIMGQIGNGAAIIAQTGGAANVAILVDTRTTNLNSAKVEGFDMHLNYETDTGFGHVTFTNNATVATRGLQTNGGATTNELGHGQPRFTMASSVGLNHGPVSAKVTVNYSGKFHDNGTDYLGVSEDVKAFIVTNLNLGYAFGNGMLRGSSVRLTVNNLFNVSPQTIMRSNTNNPSYNNWTLGRVFKLGFTAKF